MIYSAPGVVKNPIDTPEQAFSTLFGGLVPTDPAVVEQKARRKSVLDTVLKDMNSRRAKLSSADKLRLEGHAESVRELEARLISDNTTPQPACNPGTAPSGSTAQTATDDQIRVAVAAMGCGLTNILSLQMRIADTDSSPYPWLGVSEGHHDLSHGTSSTNRTKLTAIYKWYAERFANLLTGLAATDDPSGGKLLDNTLVIWGTELGDGYSHDHNNTPFILAGGPSVVRGGRYLRLSGQNHHRVLVTALHAMGLTDVSRYGSLDTRGSSGPLSDVLV